MATINPCRVGVGCIQEYKSLPGADPGVFMEYCSTFAGSSPKPFNKLKKASTLKTLDSKPGKNPP